MTKQPVQLTPEGSVRCAYCRDDDWGLPHETERVSEAHWGVRFSPFYSGSGPCVVLGAHPGEMTEWHWKITLDGEDVTKHCVEFEWGDQGWVALYHLNADRQRVRCGGALLHTDFEHPLIFIERGKVVAEKIPNLPTATS